MNIYQKILSKYVKYIKIEYEYKLEDIQTFRWHRCQIRLIEKLDKENNLQDIIKNKNLALNCCVKDGLI